MDLIGNVKQKPYKKRNLEYLYIFFINLKFYKHFLIYKYSYPPNPPPFTGKYESLNGPINTKKCTDKDYDYSSYLLEVKFRKEAESAADCF